MFGFGVCQMDRKRIVLIYGQFWRQNAFEDIRI